MSVVIVGGNERMACRYATICKSFGCKAKVFTKENGTLKKKMGFPDALIVFTGTVSHKMMISASEQAKQNNIPVLHVHSSSSTALHNALTELCSGCPCQGNCSTCSCKKGKKA
jgi:hypothetical protein